jgi:hypothetical protein
LNSGRVAYATLSAAAVGRFSPLVAIKVRFRRKLATAEREIQAGPAAVESAGAGLVPFSSDLCHHAINVLSVSFDPLSLF